MRGKESITFEMNGILYADEHTRELEVRSARVTDDHVMLVTFSTSETRLCDFTKMYDDVPAFAPLRDEKTFEDFRIDHGIPTWRDGDIDISPTYLYEHSYEYTPLRANWFRRDAVKRRRHHHEDRVFDLSI